MKEPKDIKTIEALEQEIGDVLVMKDKGVIKTIMGAMVASRMSGDPVFLFVVGKSSGGKTELINMLVGLKFVRQLDTLTSNTFASGAPKRNGQQNSLLLKIQNGVISIKDFTTILQMNETARKEILSQLRVIFDGTFNKETGLGDSIAWRGKISMIAAVTTVIYQQGNEYKSMGERFINYEMEQPTDEEVNRRMVKNAYDMAGKRKHMADCVKNYVEYITTTMGHDQILLPEDQFKILMDVSKYSVNARSGLECDPRDASRITFKPDKEGAGRLFGQLFALARAFITMRQVENNLVSIDGKDVKGNEHRLSDDEMAILVKIALCSIPRKRRDALKLLAKYTRGVSTGGVAVKLGYNTMVIRATMYELNALDFCYRKRDGMKDIWQLADDWRDLILKYEEITKADPTEILEADASGEEDFMEANTDDYASKYKTGDAKIDNF